MIASPGAPSGHVDLVKYDDTYPRIQKTRPMTKVLVRIFLIASDKSVWKTIHLRSLRVDVRTGARGSTTGSGHLPVLWFSKTQTFGRDTKFKEMPFFGVLGLAGFRWAGANGDMTFNRTSTQTFIVSCRPTRIHVGRSDHVLSVSKSSTCERF